MKKEKIAISLDGRLLKIIDSYIDHNIIRSRSQAIENLLNEAIKTRPLSDAVMLLHESSIKYLDIKMGDTRLIQKHLDFLEKNNISNLYIITKVTPELNRILSNLKTKINIDIINEKEQKGNALVLGSIKEIVKGNFLVFNGDTLNDFYFQNMLNEFFKSDKLMIMGLISSQIPSQRGAVILEGDLVIDFKEKKETLSHIINAGIYIFRPEIFNYLDSSTKSLEIDLFPKLAKMREIKGFFTYGTYVHLPKMNVI